MKYLLDSGGSVLDLVMDEARSLERLVTSRDREKLGEYFSPSGTWNSKFETTPMVGKTFPKNRLSASGFDPVGMNLSLECESIMYDLITLALETDSTRHFIPRSGIGSGIHHKWTTA